MRGGDAAAWVLQELNRRIARFTYHPETVKDLPNSAWASAPPYFANADEQANLNDVLASALSGSLTHSGGVEFMEARFRERFAPRKCFTPRAAALPSNKAECNAVSEARRLMRDGRWKQRLVTLQWLKSSTSCACALAPPGHSHMLLALLPAR